MKKFTWLLSLASLMVPMTLSAQQVKKDVTSDVTLLKGSSSLLKKNVPAPADKQVQKLSGLTKGSSLRRGPKAEPSADAVVWDFESEDQFNEWTLVDNDGDGFNWEYFNNNVSEEKMNAHEGYGLVASASYVNETKTALTPDNWMISPEVSLGGVLSFWACGQDASYFAEVFGVYVCEGSSTDPADFVQVGKDKTATDVMTMYDFDLSKYAGKTGRIAIRHYHVTDMFFLDIDDVCIDNSATCDPDPEDPTDITVAPTATSAVVTWEGADGDNWNLRYKVYNPNEKVELLWDLPYDGYEDQVEGWSIYDADGDGYNWGLAYSSNAYDDLCFYSESYIKDTDEALTPDNWLITPEVRLGGVFKFDAKNDNYPDVLGVYVQTADRQFGQIVQIGEDKTPDTDWETFTFDTSNYDGQLGNIIIRHYNSEDQYKIYVDNVSYTKDGDEPAEWIDVNGLTDTNYTIEGLDPETDYMVQVQAYNDKAETDWSDSVFFSTDAEANAATGIEAVANSSADASVYTVTGVQVSKLSRLPKGVYIVGGKKVVVK